MRLVGYVTVPRRCSRGFTSRWFSERQYGFEQAQW